MPHTPKRVVPVAVDVTAADGTVTITCTPNPAHIIKDTKNALLVFTLNTSGYRFRTANAITLDEAVDGLPLRVLDDQRHPGRAVRPQQGRRHLRLHGDRGQYHHGPGIQRRS